MKIDIPMMRGEIPRFKEHLLPDEAAAYALDCRFERGIVSPIKDSRPAFVLPIAANTLFKYSAANWLCWSQRVSAIQSPMAQDEWERVYWTGAGRPKVTAQDIAIGANGFGPAAWYDLGIPRPTSSPVVLSVDGSTGEEPPAGEAPIFDDEDRLYIQTYVSRFGEEGAPGEPSQSVLIEKPGSTVTVKLTQPTINTQNITHTRLYRSVTVSGEADYLLVAEVPISQGQYVDGAKAVNGPVLETWDYDEPDENMQGLCQMANGICAGFAGNEVMFSDAYLPYAWPAAYRGTTEHQIVSVAAIGTSLVVVTKGYPYVFSGVTPSAINGAKLPVEQACVSDESLVVLNGMGVYASPDGLVAVAADGAHVLTDQLIDRESWQAFKPHTIKAVSVEGLYVAQYEGGAFIFDPVSQDFTRLSESWVTAVNDIERDVLMVVDGTEVKEWQQAETVRPYTWRSKEYLMPLNSVLSSARVQSLSPHEVTIRFIADGVVVFELHAGELDHCAFRLPAVRACKWQVEVSGTSDVERILIASSMQELS